MHFGSYAIKQTTQVDRVFKTTENLESTQWWLTASMIKYIHIDNDYNRLKNRNLLRIKSIR